MFLLLFEELRIQQHPIARYLQCVPVSFPLRDIRIIGGMANTDDDIRRICAILVVKNRTQPFGEDWLSVLKTALRSRKYGPGTIFWVEVGEREVGSLKADSTTLVVKTHACPTS